MPYKVLVVDDFEPVRNMYVDVLKRCPVEVIVAENGEDALRHIYTEKPNIILLDVDLPRMSGLEVLKRVRGNSTTKNMCVIMVTGNHNVEHTEIASDADLVLIKPVSPTDLVNFVNRFLPAQNG